MGGNQIYFPLYNVGQGKRYTGACTNISADTSNILKAGDSHPTIDVTLYKTTPLYRKRFV